ncbi:MAG: S1/P1 nuclease [Verrucomicrobiota bacterium]
MSLPKVRSPRSALTLRYALIVALALSMPSLVSAYGPLGHQIVGAVADQKLAGTVAGKKVGLLLGGTTLERASTIADEIKAWDQNGAGDLTAYPHYPKTPWIEQQLREFWLANAPGPQASDTAPSHHWMHYTDVPVFAPETYREGKIGRGNWDIVHAIPYCIGVLRGEITEKNPRKITKLVALILLAHLVGDIHQPLHVGAEYFSEAGEPTDADHLPDALADDGGNTLTLVENATAERPRHYFHSFHSYWDSDTVRNLVIETPDELPKEKRDAVYQPAREKLIAEFSRIEPAKWRTEGDASKWAEKWADEILPIAREAHARLRFDHVHREEKDGRAFARGQALERETGYLDWSTGVVREELHKAGWRLARLLEASLP